jgi:4-amino-4-deoxy-L-arabinose transferase-like glycosyltransferase
VPDAFDWKFYGPAWPLTLKIINDMSGIEYVRYFWELRHFLTFALFFVGLIFFYRLGKKMLGDWRLALLGVVFFVLSPRVFAHAFYNPKDIPAMVLTIVCIDLLLTFMRSRSRSLLILLSVLCALLASMRPIGFLVPLFFIVLLIAELKKKRPIPFIAAHLVLFTLFLFAVWPLLWHQPLTHFLQAMHGSADRAGGGLYFGRMIEYTPWHYIPMWLAITTPWLYTVLFCIGTASIVRSLIKQKKKDRQHILLLVWFFLPLFALIVTRAGIFDEWRHVMFLYPAFLLIGLVGLQHLQTYMKTITRRPVLPALVALCLLQVVVWMVTWHPFEYAYFSIPAAWADGNFELDYWSLSYRSGWEWITKHDTRNKIYVYAMTNTGEKGGETIPLADMQRLYFVPLEYADYVLDNFRENQYKKLAPADYQAHSVTVDGVEILGIYFGPHSRVDPHHHDPAPLELMPD